jgi:hypothetical protein
MADAEARSAICMTVQAHLAQPRCPPYTLVTLSPFLLQRQVGFRCLGLLHKHRASGTGTGSSVLCITFRPIAPSNKQRVQSIRRGASSLLMFSNFCARIPSAGDNAISPHHSLEGPCHVLVVVGESYDDYLQWRNVLLVTSCHRELH